MKMLIGKVVEVRETKTGRFAIIAVRDEMFDQVAIFDHLHLACDALTAVGDEISALISIKSPRAAKAVADVEF